MKKLILSFLLVVSAVSLVYGQETSSQSGDPNKKQFIIGGLWDNWFFSAGGGINLYIGDYNDNLNEHLSPAIDLSVGKWLFPVFGLRMQYNGFSMDATGDPSYWFTDDSPGLSHVKFSYHAVHSDFMLNLTTAVRGYNPDRKYQLIPYFGWGWSRSQKDYKVRNEYFAVAGLKNDFRLSNSLDLNLELRAVLVSQRLAGHMIGGHYNIPVAATIGLTYHFGGEKARQWKTVPLTDNY